MILKNSYWSKYFPQKNDMKTWKISQITNSQSTKDMSFMKNEEISKVCCHLWQFHKNEMKNKCEYCDQKFAARCATIHEEKKYDLNVNIVIKNLLLDVPAKRVLSSDYNSWGKEICFECDYCDRKSATHLPLK